MSTPTEIIEFPLDGEGEGSVFIQAMAGTETLAVAASDEPGFAGDADTDELVPRATNSFNSLAERVKPAANVLMASLKDLNSPAEIELEFGIALGGKAGIVFASTDAQVNFKVKLKWTNPSPAP